MCMLVEHEFVNIPIFFFYFFQYPRWADMCEYDFGVAVLNDGKYGWSSQTGRLTLSLLRSPKSPDPECDMRLHSFRYALMPHTGQLLLE